MVDAENGSGETHRRWTALGLPLTGEVRYFEAVGFDLAHEDALASLESTLGQSRLLVLDSFKSLWPSGDENESSGTTQVLEGLRSMARQRGVAIVLLHHSGKNGTSGYRGSTAIAASCDLLVRLEKRKGALTLSADKFRLGPQPEPVRLMVSPDEGGRVVFIPATSAPATEDAGALTTGPERLADQIVSNGVLSDVPVSNAEVARRVGRTPGDGTVKRALKLLGERGAAVREESGWVIAGSGGERVETHDATPIALDLATATEPEVAADHMPEAATTTSDTTNLVAVSETDGVIGPKQGNARPATAPGEPDCEIPFARGRPSHDSVLERLKDDSAPWDGS